MQEYKSNYSDFYDDSDPQGRPYGAAKDTTTPNTIDGTPIKASMVNDILGMLHASFVGASENDVPVLSGTPDKVGQSQYWDALKGFIVRRDTRHGSCATAGDDAVKVIQMANGLPAAFEKFFVVFDNDNTADDVQFQIGEITADVHVGKFQAGIGAFNAGVPYEFVYDGAKFMCVNSDVVKLVKGVDFQYRLSGDGRLEQWMKKTIGVTSSRQELQYPVAYDSEDNLYGSVKISGWQPFIASGYSPHHYLTLLYNRAKVSIYDSYLMQGTITAHVIGYIQG